jgi:selenocysteine lyase/cysteine desulfurase
VRRAFLDRMEPPYLDVLSGPWRESAPAVRDDARRFETSENAFALQLGLGAAIRYTLDVGVDAIRDRIDLLARRLRDRLSDIPGIRLNDAGQERSGIVTFMVDGVPPQEVRRSLAAERINIAAIAAAYTPLDMAARELSEIIRASVTYFSTEAEIDHLADAVAALMIKLT